MPLKEPHLQSPSENPLRDFLNSPPLIIDAQKIKKYLIQFVALRIFVVSALLGVSAWKLASVRESNSTMWLLLALIYLISLINAWLIHTASNAKTAGYIQLALETLLATLVIIATGSNLSVMLYVLVITQASIVFGGHGAVIIAALCGILYGLITTNAFSHPSLFATTSSVSDILLVYITLVTSAVLTSRVAAQFRVIKNLAQENAKEFYRLFESQKLLLEDITDGIVTIDTNGIITGLNKAAKKLLGFTHGDAERAIGNSLLGTLKQLGITDSEISLNPSENEEAPRTLAFAHPKNKKEQHLTYMVKSLLDPEGATIGKLVIFNDISELKNIEVRLDLHERMSRLLSETTPQQASKGKAHLIGESLVMKKVFSLVERVAPTASSVLITGESGTGKEVIAKAIHKMCFDGHKPFVAVNCGAIPEGLIESELFGHKKGSFTGAIADAPGLFRQAEGGTIFLDEIAELPENLQPKLLRVLQERKIRPVGDTRDIEINVRVIAATNKNLKKEIQEGRFREDLFFRLNVVNVFLPPLRERKEDIPLFISHFIGKWIKEDTPPRISPDALKLLTNYSYPGNVRELENIIERALVLGGNAILPEHLPEEVRNNAPVLEESLGETEILILPIQLEELLGSVEKKYLLKALQDSQGIKKHAAEMLGLNFRSFRYRLKKYGLSEEKLEEMDDN